MEFQNYLEIRQLFNAKKDSLSPENIQVMIKELGHFFEKSVSGRERELIEDLLDDMEIHADMPRLDPVTNGDQYTTEAPATVNLINFIEPSKYVVVTILNDTPTNLVEEAELEVIRMALIRTAGNRTAACKYLGISIRTLRNKINEYRNTGRINEYDLSRVC